ncbi:MAG: hypothetical protein IPF77_16830 [Gemmatimonadetes bacterium]|nr:hypothetical protein [Gemmatimonadota bacterium]
MSTPNPTPAREAVEIARNDLALRIAMDVLGDMGRADGLAEWLGRDGTDLGQAVARLITAARADERAQWAAARERAIEEAAALCDTALKTIPPKSIAAAEVLHLAGRIRALAGQKGET